MHVRSPLPNLSLSLPLPFFFSPFLPSLLSFHPLLCSALFSLSSPSPLPPSLLLSLPLSSSPHHLCDDQATDKASVDLSVAVLVKPAPGVLTSGEMEAMWHKTVPINMAKITETLMEGGQTAFLPGRLQRLKMALSCHMKPIKVRILPQWQE